MDQPWVQQLVDALLDRAGAEHPRVEYVVSVPQELIVLVSQDSDKLWRTVEQRLGYYRTHVYRDREIMESPVNAQVVAAPLLEFGNPGHPCHQAPTYIADLDTGMITAGA
jgi:hypothetical protein